MKKHALLFLFSLLMIGFIFPDRSFAQKSLFKMQNGKIITSDTVKCGLTKEQIVEKLNPLIANLGFKEEEMLLSDGAKMTTLYAPLTDYLVMTRSKFSTFAILMSYYLSFEVFDNKCITKVSGIRYTDTDEFQKQFSDQKYEPVSYPGEDILLKKQYKAVFVKNASDRIIDQTILRVNEIFASARGVLKK